jgi:hypothetical protein
MLQKFLSEILEEQGLKFTPSGALLTRTGSLITFQEAQEKGYFKEISVSLDKIFEFFKERDRQRERLEQVAIPDSAGSMASNSFKTIFQSSNSRRAPFQVTCEIKLQLNYRSIFPNDQILSVNCPNSSIRRQTKKKEREIR